MESIEIKPNRFSFLIPLPLIALLMYVFIRIIFQHNNHEPKLPTMMYVVGGFVCAAGTFLFIYFFKSFCKPHVIIRLDNNGFEYKPAGASFGFIQWTEVEDIRDVQVLSNNGRQARTVICLGVALKNPKEFRKKFSWFKRNTLGANESMYGVSVLIQPSTLGKRFAGVKQIMEEQLLHVKQYADA